MQKHPKYTEIMKILEKMSSCLEDIVWALESVYEFQWTQIEATKVS